MSVSIECCVSSGRGLCDGQTRPADCGVSECDCEGTTARMPWPPGGLSPLEKINHHHHHHHVPEDLGVFPVP